mgnify:CR=1 FL=1
MDKFCRDLFIFSASPGCACASQAHCMRALMSLIAIALTVTAAIVVLIKHFLRIRKHVSDVKGYYQLTSEMLDDQARESIVDYLVDSPIARKVLFIFFQVGAFFFYPISVLCSALIFMNIPLTDPIIDQDLPVISRLGVVSVIFLWLWLIITIFTLQTVAAKEEIILSSRMFSSQSRTSRADRQIHIRQNVKRAVIMSSLLMLASLLSFFTRAYDGAHVHMAQDILFSFYNVLNLLFYYLILERISFIRDHHLITKLKSEATRLKDLQGYLRRVLDEASPLQLMNDVYLSKSSQGKRCLSSHSKQEETFIDSDTTPTGISFREFSQRYKQVTEFRIETYNLKAQVASNDELISIPRNLGYTEILGRVFLALNFIGAVCSNLDIFLYSVMMAAGVDFPMRTVLCVVKVVLHGLIIPYVVVRILESKEVFAEPVYSLKRHPLVLSTCSDSQF